MSLELLNALIHIYFNIIEYSNLSITAPASKYSPNIFSIVFPWIMQLPMFSFAIYDVSFFKFSTEIKASTISDMPYYKEKVNNNRSFKIISIE